MPIIRKVIAVGNSKAVCIPKSWLEYHEKEQGKPIEAVTIKVNKVLVIAPFFSKQAK